MSGKKTTQPTRHINSVIRRGVVRRVQVRVPASLSDGCGGHHGLMGSLKCIPRRRDLVFGCGADT